MIALFQSHTLLCNLTEFVYIWTKLCEPPNPKTQKTIIIIIIIIIKPLGLCIGLACTFIYNVNNWSIYWLYLTSMRKSDIRIGNTSNLLLSGGKACQILSQREVYGDRQKHWRFGRLTFDHRGHPTKLEVEKNLMQERSMVPHGSTSQWAQPI